MVSRTQIVDEKSRQLILENYSKLSLITLAYPEKLDQLTKNMFQAGLGLEFERDVKEIVELNPEDAFSNDLLATYYTNTGRLKEEIAIREKMRNLDPWNVKLELALSQAYVKNGDVENFNESIKRIKFIAPESEEYRQAISLKETIGTNP